MKVLYLGYFHDGTGWCQGAVNTALSLDAAGVDVVCRSVKLNDREYTPPARILELEKKSAAECDIVIQHLLPPMTEYRGGMKNIAVCYLETNSLPHSVWPHHLQMMDEVWVSCKHNQSVLIKELFGFTRAPRVHAFPIGTDTSKYLQYHPKLTLFDPWRESNSFKFYSIAEFTKRKNFGAMLAAWHLEFDRYEGVDLFIKSSGNREALVKFNEKVKRSLKLNKTFKDPVIVDQRLTDDEMLSFHSECDCFISTSHGEAWCIPAIDALGMGKTPIVPGHTAFIENFSRSTAYLVDCYLAPALEAFDTFDELYTGDEHWYRTDILSLRRKMRGAFREAGIRQNKARIGKEHALGFDYHIVGKTMKEHLDGSKARS